MSIYANDLVGLIKAESGSLKKYAATLVEVLSRSISASTALSRYARNGLISGHSDPFWPHGSFRVESGHSICANVRSHPYRAFKEPEIARFEHQVTAISACCRAAAESTTTRHRPVQLLQRAAQFARRRVNRVDYDRGTTLLNGCDQLGDTTGREVRCGHDVTPR